MKCPCCDGCGTSNTCINGTFQPCIYCNGTGEVDEIVQKFKNPYTNFQCITASPEALAEFLGTWFVLPCELCEHFRHDKCTAKISERHCDEAEAFEKWLNEECKE